MQRESFVEFLRLRGLRLTREREAIVDEVLRRRGHFDIETLIGSLKARGAKVSTASVYRTLPLMVECGLLSQVEARPSQSRYEPLSRKGHHDHMRCLGCDQIFEFYSEELERLQERICAERAFTGQAHTLEIRGLCRKCGTRGRVPRERK